MQKSQLKLMGAVAAVAVIAGGGVGVWSVMKDDSPNNVLLSAEEGAAARAERSLRLPVGGAESAAMSIDTRIAADSMPIDCDVDYEPYVPTEEELAEVNADADALAAMLEQYGITHQLITDPSGYRYVETDYADMVAVSVVSSFWEQRHPAVPPSQSELDAVVQQNDVLARYLDEAGVTYTRSTDAFGWESLEYDYENVTAQEAIDNAYAELYPPQPPTAEELATMTADNDKLAAAFDAAGIAYTRNSDELGWEWIDWDYEDEALNEKVYAVYSELYPPLPIDGCAMPMDDSMTREVVVDGAADGGDELQTDEPEAPAEEASTIEEILPAEEFTPEQIAQRDAEAAALASGFEAAGVTVRVEGESPWQIVLFDVSNDAAVDVVASVLATRG